MNRLVRLALAASILAATSILAACGPHGVWTKEGATTSETETAQKACVRESGQYGFLLGDGAPGESGSRGLLRTRQTKSGDFYRLCMSRRGFGKVPEAEAESE